MNIEISKERMLEMAKKRHWRKGGERHERNKADETAEDIPKGTQAER
mgnify:FL=1